MLPDRLTVPLDRTEALRLAPAFGVLAVWAVLMPASGGFNPRDWLPAGLGLLGLLAVAMTGGGRVLPAGRPAQWALGALAAYTAWSYASLAWAAAPGAAWAASNLLLVTLLTAWTLALLPWRVRTADALLAAFGSLVAAVCAVELAGALAADDLTGRFLDFRWIPPLDYPNTTAAFASMAAIPPLVLAARPDVAVPVKAVGQAVATFLAAFALLPQSRGAVLGAAAALLVLLVAVPFRWRLIAHVAALAAVLVPVSGPVFDVYAVAEASGRVSGALGDAARTIALGTGVALLLGAALGLVEARWAPGPGGARAARLGGATVAAAVLLAAGGLAAAHADGIRDALGDQWRSLEHPGVEFGGSSAPGSSRLTDADPLQRYDYWRVGVAGLRDAPVGGMGAGGFEHRYVRERRYAKVSKYPHNLAVKVAGDTGAVGVLLVAAFLAAALWGLLGRPGSAGVGERGVVAAAAGVAAYVAAHGMFDWLEAYPVITGPAAGFVFVALAVRAPADRLAAAERVDSSRRPGAAGGRLRVAAGAAAAVLGVGAAASLALPWLATRYADRATSGWRADPAGAYHDLDRAAALDPLDPRPLVLAGVIALERRELRRARRAFGRALEREQQWLPHLGLALVAAAEGDAVAARRAMGRAVAINPRDPTLTAAARAIARGRRIDPVRTLRDVLASPLFGEERLS